LGKTGYSGLKTGPDRKIKNSRKKARKAQKTTNQQQGREGHKDGSANRRDVI
jgi:hypothetical protein